MAEQAQANEASTTANALEAGQSQRELSFARLIGSSMAVRVIVDTGVQLFNPFLAQIAFGLGTNVVVLGRLVGLRSATGLLSPLFGALADQYGFQRVMRAGLLVGGLGALIVGASLDLLTVALGMILWGIGVAAFVPTLQAYVSAQLPYRQRGRGIGILEYSWALAGILGLFFMGRLIETAGWRAPFFVLGGGMVLANLLFATLPTAAHRPPMSTAAAPNVESTRGALWRRMGHFFALGPHGRSAYATIIGSAILFFAAMQIMIAHGAWLTAEYGLRPAQLGTVALMLGLSDLLGSGLVSLITDRLGKRRSVLLGSTGALIGFVLLPFLNVTVALAVVGIALARACFEFAIVSNISLLSEQVPQQRGKVMTLGAAANLFSATLAGAIGPWMYTVYGVGGLSALSAVLAGISIGVVARGVRELDHEAV